MQKSTMESAPWQRPLYGFEISQEQVGISLKTGVLGQSGGEGSLRAWATRIAVNEALNFIRNNHHQELTVLKDDDGDVAEEEDPPVEDIPPEAIQQMVRQLPTGYRTVFNLYVFENKRHKEIAQLLGISVSTSISQLSKAKNRMAQMIQEFHDNKRRSQ